MIQRIQSLFLLLSAVFAIVLFFVKVSFPAAVNEKDVNNLITVCYVSEYQQDDDGFKTKPLYFSGILNTLVAVISLLTIFLYKNRIRQSLFCRLNILLGAGLIVAIIFVFENYGGVKQLIGNESKHYLILILPALSVLFSYLANLFILKDERLVRSADRIR